MTPLDAAVAILLVALCAHVGVLIVALVRGSLPQRRHPQKRTALVAGGLALVGELLALRGLLGNATSPGIVLGILGLALVAGFAARSAWREHPAGRAAFHAVLAAPLVLAFVALLSLR